MVPFAAIIASHALAGSAAPRLRPDGFHPEWAAVVPLATDPIGDNAGAFDVTTLRAASRGANIPGDLDADGDVDFNDLNALLPAFNSDCPTHT